MTVKRLVILVVLALIAFCAYRCIDKFVQGAQCLIAHQNEAVAREGDQ